MVLLLKPPVPEEDLPWWEEVIKRWADEEPEAAAAWAQGFFAPDVLLFAALKPLARKNLRAALTVARRVTGSMWRARSELPAAAAERDPRGTMDFLAKEPRFLTYFGAKAMGVWLRNDPAAACAWMRADPSRWNLMATVLPDLSEAAPEQILALMASLPAESTALKGMKAGMAWADAARDFPGTLEKFKTLHRAERECMKDVMSVHAALHATPEEINSLLASLDKDERYSMMFTMASFMSGADEERLFAVLKTEGLSPAERNQILASCATLGPRFAPMFMDAAKNSGDYNAVQGAASFWSYNLHFNPSETLPALQKMVESGQVDMPMLLAMTSRMGAGDNERLIAALPEEMQAAPRARLVLARAVNDPSVDVTTLELKDPKTASALLSGFFNGSGGGHEQLRDLILRLPVSMQAEAIEAFPLIGNDASTLAPVLGKILASGQADSEKLTSALQKIVRNMPGSQGQAMQWLDTLPPGSAVDAARSHAFYSWASENEAAASAWLETQPSDLSGRAEMVRTVVDSLSSHDPEGAWQWVASLPESRERESLFDAILSNWRVTDPLAAATAEIGRER
jgi:hypothetical protein